MRAMPKPPQLSGASSAAPPARAPLPPSPKMKARTERATRARTLAPVLAFWIAAPHTTER